MMRKRLATAATAFVLACLLSVGAMGAMISGLNLPVDHLHQLHVAWAITAAVGCILFSLQKSWLPAMLAVLGLGYLWEYHDLALPIQALISRLSWLYGSAYGWGMVEFAGLNWREMALDLPLGAWGCCVALAVTATMAAGRSMIPALVFALLPVGAALVVTNTPPDAPYVFAVLLASILLILPATVRRHSPHQGTKLTLLTALPITLALWALFAAFPQDTYVNHSQDYLNSVIHWWQSRISVAWDSSGLLGQSAGAVKENTKTNLDLLGPRANWTYPVMDVTSQRGGTIYLRGQDYDVYDGGNWTATPDREEWFTAQYDTADTITISTRRDMKVLYLPYYPADEKALTGGRLDNGENLREYTVTQADFPAYLVSQMLHPHPGGGTTSTRPVDETYLSLPENTLEWAAAYLEQHIPEVWDVSLTAISQDEYHAASLSNSQIAQLIGDHVFASAAYDTATGRMDRDSDDFVRWFLEESDTGYCVHFATAAAVLLRAADVPARYVTGYMFQAEAGEVTTVRADRAHAWVEYYEPLVGNWVVLEATPPDLRDTEPLPTEIPDITAGTEPPTEETAEPPTENDESTRPTGAPRPNTPQGPKRDLSQLWTALKWAAGMALAWLAVLVQYRVRRSLRRKGGPNQRALHKWRDAELLCRLTKQTPPEELEELAQKAKFSQHTITAEELHTFDIWLTAQRMKHQAWYWNIVCKYALAIW